MKIPSPATSDTDTDAEIEALLAAADAKVEARKSGGGEEAPQPPPDLDEHGRRNALWVRPWARKARPEPNLGRGVKVGEPVPGFARVLRSCPGDAAGPWLALTMVGTYDQAKALKAFGKWWERHRAEFIDAGVDYQAEAGKGEAGRAWLELLWPEVVGQCGRVHVFPAPGSDQEQVVADLLGPSASLAYERAWRQLLRRPKPRPAPTLEHQHQRAGKSVGQALAALEAARVETRKARGARDKARKALAQAQRHKPVRAWLHARGWRCARLARLHATLEQAEQALTQAKDAERQAERKASRRQQELDDIAEAYRKSLAA